jgi:cytochrome c peroxidase
VNCHFPPLYTDRLIHDVGTKGPGDTKGEFDSCHLTNIYDSAPYLHNGIAHTLEEIWTLYNPYDLHGVTNDLTKDQLNDLIRPARRHQRPDEGSAQRLDRVSQDPLTR